MTKLENNSPYLAFPIWNAVRTKLSWTHYRIISRIDIQETRNHYIQLASDGSSDTRTLQRNISSNYLMYVGMYNDLKKGDDDNQTIGLILCTEKDETIVKYSVLAENEKLFASKYRLYLPKEEELRQLINADKIKYELDND